jgi:hypothetical protein
MYFTAKLSQFTSNASYMPRDIQHIAKEGGLLGTATEVAQAKYKIVALNTKFYYRTMPVTARSFELHIVFQMMT